MVWLWAAGNTKTDTVLIVPLHFSPPEGSSSIIFPASATATITFYGPKSSLKSAKEACTGGLTLTVPTTSGTAEINLATRISELDAIRFTGVEISSIDPKTIDLQVKTMVSVVASVVPVLNGVQISGDITVDPATVTLLIPSSIRDTLPEVITVSAILAPSEIALLQHGVVQTKNAGVQLPVPLDLPDVIVDPSTVSISFKIQSNTAKTEVAQVRVLLAGPAEDYSGYSIELPRKFISNVTIEADAELIEQIINEKATIFAFVRLSSRDMELGIDKKKVTVFLAITEDGIGHEVQAMVEDPSLLLVDLEIQPFASNVTAE
jgi:hypothetical protein